MAGFFEKLFGGSNKDYDDYNYDEYNEMDDYYDEADDSYRETTAEAPYREQSSYRAETPEPYVAPQTERRRPAGRVVDINQKTYLQQIVIMEPSDIETAQQVCDDVREGKTVICNIEKIDPKIAQRVIDFITGAAHALRGNVMPISALIFVVAPGTTSIENSVQNKQNQSDRVEDYVRRATVYAR